MNIDAIKNIEELISLKDKKIVSQTVKRLTAPGDNYGSLMLRVDLVLATKTGNENLHVVAKMVPPNEHVQKMFNTPTTFRNEIGFYRNIIPALRNFQREHNVEHVIDFCPHYYGGRLNLRGDDNGIDSDAAIVLENLKTDNYDVLQTTEGFDFDVAKLFLEDLAYLHALPIALKLQKPDVFQQEVLPFLSTWHSHDYENLKVAQYKIIDSSDEMKKFKERILTAFDKQALNYKVREPFATVCQNDSWINNIMVKIVEGKVVKIKLVDYQVCNYGSPGRDLIFFLFSSVKMQVIEQHYDDLLRFYYKNFIKALEEVHCDTNPFTFEALQRDIEEEAKTTQFGHVLFMLLPIYIARSEVQDVTEFHPSSLTEAEPNEHHRRRFEFVVKEFVKRNWI